MSSKVRRQKDIVTNATESYLAASSAYSNYFEGQSPVSIIYYQIADEASRTDTDLEDTHEIVGTQSSLYYNRIKNVTVYGVNALDIDTQLTQRGVESFITGDFVMTPDLQINPRPGELFAFDVDDTSYPELGQHLFVISDVQYDRATSQKYYKCTFKLYPLDTDNIYSHVYKKYIYKADGNGNTVGVGNSKLITEEEAASEDAINNLTDGLIDTFESLFYNEGMDTFTYQKAIDTSGTNFEYYWSPYLCHFIYKNELLEKTDASFLTEIFLQDVDEHNYANIYSEKGYRTSLYHAVEVDDPDVVDPINGVFMEISPYNLNAPLNLPFYSTAEPYHLVNVAHPYNKTFWLGAFNWMFDDEDNLYINISGDYKYHADDDNETYDLETYLIDKGVMDSSYNIIRNQEVPFEVPDNTFYGIKDADSQFDIGEIIRVPNSGSVFNADFESVFHTGTGILSSDVDYLVYFIRQYFTKQYDSTGQTEGETQILLTQNTINALNDYYYDNSIRTYLLLPVVIYILKNYNN